MSSEETSVPLSNLLTDSFISKNTRYKTLEEFFEKSGLDTSSEESFVAIPDEDMDRYVSENSNFTTWSEMLETALQELLAKKLGF